MVFSWFLPPASPRASLIHSLLIGRAAHRFGPTAGGHQGASHAPDLRARAGSAADRPVPEYSRMKTP